MAPYQINFTPAAEAKILDGITSRIFKRPGGILESSAMGQVVIGCSAQFFIGGFSLFFRPIQMP